MTAVPLLVLLAGCGGITASHSVSPATFLLPGLSGPVKSRPDAVPMAAVGTTATRTTPPAALP